MYTHPVAQVNFREDDSDETREFDCDPPTREIPHETMSEIIYGVAVAVSL